jgi:thiosulfate/3-mercaptopyruvate sulfurtransferase
MKLANTIFLFSILFLMNCKKYGDYQFLPLALKSDISPYLVWTNSAESLAFASNDDYNLNQYGLVTGSTLKLLAENWSTSKPFGITGKLVVLQIQAGTTSSGKYFPTNTNTGVYSYLVEYNSTTQTSTIFGQSRSNGITTTETMVPQGSVVDAFLKTYGIHPGKDLIVLASDTSTSSNLWNSLRAFYALRYWGLDKKNLAVLNGSIDQLSNLGEITTTNTRNTSVNQTNALLKTLLSDNTILQATLGDVIHNVLLGKSTFEKVSTYPSNGVVFLDARASTEFSPSAPGQTNGPSGKTCVNGTSCKTAFDGNIKGSVNLPWGNLVKDSANNDFRFKTKSEISTILQSVGITGNKQVITYCRTAVRAMVTFFATHAIVGYPTRVYDGSWIEWSAFAFDENDPQIWSNLRANSSWRTDKSSLTSNLTLATDSGSVSKYSYDTTQNFSKSSNAIVDEDRLYIRGQSTSSSGSSSGGTTSGGGGNACGG